MLFKKCKVCGGQVLNRNKETKYCSRNCFYINLRKTRPLLGRKNPKMSNEKHPKWRGDKVGYKALHLWVRKHLNGDKKCEFCKKELKLDVANVSGKYKRDLSDWKWLCRNCHIRQDGRWSLFKRALKNEHGKFNGKFKEL